MALTTITSTPAKIATEGTQYSYNPTTDGTPTSWSLTGAPTGMALNNSNGHITWTPSYDRTNSGSLHLSAFASDGTATQDWTVAVSFVTPILNNSPSTTATEHVPYTFTPDATVVDFFRYDMTGAPSGMALDSTTGIINWTPGYDKTNSGALTLTLRSLNGLSTHKDWTVAVSMIAPAITNNPGTTATEGSLYSFTPTYTAQDFSNFSLSGAPTGMSVDSITGTINWVPNYNQTNSGSLSLTIHDYNGLSSHKDWTVASTYVTPVITSTPDTTAYIATLFTYAPTATYAHLNNWTLAGAPAGMHVDPASGTISWTPLIDQTASGTLVLTIHTLNGLSADQTFSLAVAAEPATVAVSQTGSGTISPYGVKYTMTNSWILANNNVPVGIRQDVSF